MKSVSGLRHHMSSLHVEFKTAGLQKEEELRREKEKGKVLFCEKCPKIFRSERGLEKHEQVHNERRRFGCKMCGQRYKEKFVFNNHVLSHNSARTYKCDECDKDYKSQLALSDHRKRVHLLVGYHACNNCDKSFFGKSKLNLHKRRVHKKHQVQVQETLNQNTWSETVEKKLVGTKQSLS